MSGARFIMNARYFHIAKPGEKLSKYALSSAQVAGLVDYCANRETVSLNIAEDRKDLPATNKQIDVLNQFFDLVEDYKDTLEYEDYIKAPTRQNASELISRLSELLYFSSCEFDQVSNLVEYAAKRPGVIKVGEHGLFSSFENVDLEKAKDEISTHKGNIWTEIYSLRREDADKLGYNCQKPWRNLVMENIDKIAKEHRIKPENLHWYAAMHDTSYHPHIHLFIYSSDPTEGFLHKKSIENLKSAFATKIFKNELEEIYPKKDYYKKQLNIETKNTLNRLLSNPESSFEDKKLNEIANKMLTLSQRYIGKAVYGFQPKEIKEIVNEIEHSLVSSNSLLSELYGEWCNQQLNIERLYINNPNIDYPIEKNPTFTTIKNTIMKQAELLRKNGAVPDLPKIDEIIDCPTPDTFEKSSVKNTHSTRNSGKFTNSDLSAQIVKTTVNKNNYSSYDSIQKYIDKYPEQIFYSAEPENEDIKQILSTNLIFTSDAEAVKNFKSLSILANDLSSRDGEICRKLADCYNFGQGSEKDFSQAVLWYGIAADEFQDSIASYRLGQIYLHGNEQIDIDKNLGNYYCKQAFLLFRDEIKNSSFFYDLESDTDKLYYETNVPKEEAYKEYLMGHMYLKGEGVEQDYLKSYQTFLLAAENGYKHSNYYIGNQYYYGLGFNQDYKKALTYYQKASEANDSYADYRIAKMYVKGEGVNVNLQIAEEYLLKASDKVTLASYDLAKLYEDNPEIFKASNKTIFDLYNKALNKLLEQEQNAHDAFTEMRIASMYLNGKGTEINVPYAVNWLEKSAEQGNPDAAYQLGYIYSSNEYSISDPDKANAYYAQALQDYEKAEEENINATAEYRIGLIYLNALGVEQDIDKALYWLEKSTLNGNASAAYKLASLYENGELIPQDNEKAFLFYQISAELENPYACYKLGNIFLEKGDISQAIHNFEQSAEKNISHAWYKLGQIYSDEQYGVLDTEKSNICYSKALLQYISDYNENPDDFTAYRIGQMYLDAKGINQDVSNAVKWFEKSAEQGNPDAAYQLGYIYSSNEYSISDPDKANAYYAQALQDYEKAEEENINATAEYRIGLIYLNALGVEQDIDKALYWLEKSTLNGNASAAYKLASLYENGELIPQDNEKAFLFYQISAELENPYACYKLGNIFLEKGDISQAIHNFEQSAEKNISHAWYKLGQIYSDEQYGVLDTEKSNICYSKALLQYISDYNENPDDFTAYRIGQMYLDAKGINQDVSNAVKWFEKSAEQGNPDAAYQLGYIYKSDIYGVKNDMLSNKYFSFALSNYINEFNKHPFDAELAMRIGTFYNYGLGVEHDIDRAVLWYKKAVELGNKKAQEKIDNAKQTQQMSFMSVATTACHLGRILNTETIAAAKNRYTSDSKILRKEKIQKINSGQAISDSGQSYDY